MRYLTVHRNESGFLLIEALMSLTIMALTSLVVLIGMSVYARAELTIRERTVGDSIAQSQMDYIKSHDYLNLPHPVHNAYPLVTPPSGYSVSSDAEPLDPATGQSLPSGPDYGIQKIIVTVYHQSKLASTLVTYKVNR